MHTAIAGSGPNPGHWNETDPLTGIMIKFLKDLQFDAFYTAFVSQVDAFRTSQNVDLKLTYHDKYLSNKVVKGLSINPYFEMFIETSNKATVALNPATVQREYYFQVGADPTYAFSNIPLTIEFPTYVTFPATISTKILPAKVPSPPSDCSRLNLKEQCRSNSLPKGMATGASMRGSNTTISSIKGYSTKTRSSRLQNVSTASGSSTAG